MKTTFIASGDSFITRRIPNDGYEGFNELKCLIEAHDVRFANLESTFHDQEGAPAAISGGTWAMSDPALLDDMNRYGFNLFNTANNHSGDFGQGGIVATIKHLKERGMIFAGTGMTLQEASGAAYLETKHARVAMIGITSTLDPAAAAGGQGFTMKGRPGLNPLRFRTVHHVNQKHFDMAKELSDITEINARTFNLISRGYRLPFPEGTLPLGSMNFVLTDGPERNETSPNKKDLKRTLDEIAEARRQADIVIVSVHHHEMRGGDTMKSPEFIETFSKACIDAGASVVIGHGPHQLRGIECWKGGVIFYSLGNFIFQAETVARQPYDAFDGKNLPQEMNVGAYMDFRSKNGTKGDVVNPEIWRAVLPSWTIEDGKLTEVKLYPIDLGQKNPRPHRGSPKLSQSVETLEHLKQLSADLGTTIEIENGVGKVILPQ